MTMNKRWSLDKRRALSKRPASEEAPGSCDFRSVQKESVKSVKSQSKTGGVRNVYDIMPLLLGVKLITMLIAAL